MSIPTESELPPIPDKRYFSIGEAGELCGVKAHVLRYWEQEFPQLSPDKRRGNRRYYRATDIEMARRIRWLLYDHGFTIAGARARIAADAETDMSASVLDAPSTPQPGHMTELAEIRQALERIAKKLEEES